MGDKKKQVFSVACEMFEKAIGHGWKRRLARTLDVPETNIQGWIKAGRAPDTIENLLRAEAQSKKYALDVYRLNLADRRGRGSHRVVKRPDGKFAVYRFPPDQPGELIADSVPTIELARQIANIEITTSMIGQLFDELEEMRSWEAPDWAIEGGDIAEGIQGWHPFTLLDEYRYLTQGEAQASSKADGDTEEPPKGISRDVMAGLREIVVQAKRDDRGAPTTELKIPPEEKNPLYELE